MKIKYDDTRDIAIRCIDKLIDLKLLSEDEHNFEVQDLIQDEINNVLGLDIDEETEVTPVHEEQCWNCKEDIKYTDLHAFCPECLTSV